MARMGSRAGWLLAAAIIGVILADRILVGRTQAEEVPYSTFRDHLAAGRIARVTVSAATLRATLKAPLPGGAHDIVTTRVEPGLAAELTKYGVTYFGLFKIGPFMAENKGMWELFQGIHQAASEVLVIVIAIHVAAAFKHLLFDKDGVFLRMLPGRSS